MRQFFSQSPLFTQQYWPGRLCASALTFWTAVFGYAAALWWLARYPEIVFPPALQAGVVVSGIITGVLGATYLLFAAIRLGWSTHTFFDGCDQARLWQREGMLPGMAVLVLGFYLGALPTRAADNDDFKQCVKPLHQAASFKRLASELHERPPMARQSLRQLCQDILVTELREAPARPASISELFAQYSTVSQTAALPRPSKPAKSGKRSRN